MSKKDDIKNAFTDLIIKHGIRNLNMNEVLTAANVGAGTFYNYYKSKEDLIKETFYEYVSDALDSTRVDIPKGIEITDVKPYFMSYLNKMIDLMSKKNKNMEVISILGPEFKAKYKGTKPGELFYQGKEITAERLFWLQELLVRGQELNQIVKLNTDSIREMVLGAITRLLIPQIIANLSNRKSNETLNQQQLDLVKEMIWNMIAVHK